ncbi:hypothetical protein AKJ09_02683 [Labilithrix luteola]|uniref:TonB C-terminal domain-containing protein n=1 Tax=Labilithrix luteola TaxID=1391654 RepID=A0A0K1PSB1_9BACT|nr:AgmX/PglI C-terminal domain-containing protein [Labilithrix luteola]AKU96019.1 hypothetical protein AKJ09_02683 [Labilithrix luteola]
MSSNAPRPSTPPAGVPSSGNGKYIVVAALLLLGVGGFIAWKSTQKGPEAVTISMVPDASAPTAPPPSRNEEDDIPPPAPVEDAGQDAGKKVGTTAPANTGCEVKTCTGQSYAELDSALMYRVKQSRRRCYDPALAQDSTLRGKATVSVRIGTNGQVCNAGVVSSDLGNPAVASCVANSFRGSSLPAPKGGCVDVNIPVNFVPGQ